MPKLPIAVMSSGFLLLMAATITTKAQFRHVNLETSSPVTVINSEQIERTIKVNNFTEILKYTPNHVLAERASRVEIRGANSNSTLVLLNGQRIPTYSRSNNGPEPAVVPVSEIERVEVLKDGVSAVYGSDAVGGVVNFVLRTNEDLSGATNENMDYWQPYVKDVFSRPNTNYTLDDILFGDGKLQVHIVPQGDYMIETRNYIGPSGITRLNINRQFDREGSMYEEKNYFDCSGLQLQKEVNLTDPYGYTNELYEVHYENGIPAFGYRDLAPGNEFLPYRQAYNIGTGSIDPTVAPGLWKSYHFQFNKTCSNDRRGDTPGALFLPNLLFGGLSYLVEDSNEPFCMFGGGLNYTRLVTPQIGIGLDLGYYTGKQFMWDYTRFNIMAGPEFFPFNKMRSIDKFSISPFVYLGASILTQEYNNNKDSETTLSGLGGLNLGYRLSPQINIKAGAAINPVFYDNDPAWNKRLDLGVRFRF